MVEIILFGVGVILGVLLSFIWRRKIPDAPLGEIIFDDSVADIPYLAVRKHEDIDVIRSKKHVLLTVRHVRTNPQK